MSSSPFTGSESDVRHDTGLDQTGDERHESPSLDRFASELSAMIEVAAATAETLNRRLHEIGEGEHRAAAASSQLQEQLRLGARMLKAFQSQIARVEHTLAGQKAYEQQVAETQTRIEQVFTGIEACVDKTLESVALRLAEQARVALQRFEEGVAARQARLSELDERITECARGIDGICEMVEQVQASVDAAVDANQATLEQIKASAGDARAMLGQHDQARRSLANDLKAVQKESESLTRTSRDSGELMREVIAAAQRAESSLRQRFSEVQTSMRESDRLADTVTELRDLLGRLQPWEKLLLSGDMSEDGLPEPLARVAGEVKQQISQDMNWLSLTMRDVAERVTTLASATQPARSTAGTQPEAPAAARAEEEAELPIKKPLRLRSFERSG